MNGYNLLKQLYEIHSPSGREKKMRKFLKSECEMRGAQVVQDQVGNLYVTKGTADGYPCICAHMDQVQHQHSKDFTVFLRDDIIFAYSPKSKAQQGLGADDKNGLWIALELLAERDVLKCAFFVGEEVGCVGSRQADMDFFKDVLYCIEPDRRNGGDLITDICGPICSQDFVDALGYEQFGYEPTDGLMTDVETLCENGVGVSCINISCGYYNPHTDQECTVWSELKNALDFARHICATLTDRYPHEYTDAWSAWDDGWCGFGRRRKRKASSYTAFDEDMDYDTMDSILRYETHLTFEEVAKNYAAHFVTQDMDVLRCIYEDVLAYCVKNAQDDAPKLPFEDSKL